MEESLTTDALLSAPLILLQPTEYTGHLKYIHNWRR
jgi:hypothetical protein